MICVAGNILSFHVFGSIVVVLNSVETTKDLREKCGDICYDRPEVPIFEMTIHFHWHSNTRACKMTWLRIEWQWSVPISRYTEPYRLARVLLTRLLENPHIALCDRASREFLQS
jgi:hypothetical protein